MGAIFNVPARGRSNGWRQPLQQLELLLQSTNVMEPLFGRASLGLNVRFPYDVAEIIERFSDLYSELRTANTRRSKAERGQFALDLGNLRRCGKPIGKLG